MSTDTIRIFVATDQRMGASDRALAASIRDNTTGPYEITWMRAGDPGWIVGNTKDCNWQIGRPPGQPYSGEGWATDFSMFRWIIPSLCEFQGRAIYMDTDFLVLRDLREIWDFTLPWNCRGVSPKRRSDLMLLDCERFEALRWDPRSLHQMLASILNMRCMIEKVKLRASPLHWETWDTGDPDFYICFHFTNMRTQPWKPYPEIFDYPKHPNKKAVDLWNHYYERGAENPETLNKREA